MNKVFTVNNLLLTTLGFSTLIVVPTFMDPFSVPKLFVASLGAGVLLIIIIKFYAKFLYLHFKSVIFLYLTYISSIIISSIYNNLSLSSIFLGAWGRNNGLFLVCIVFVVFIASLTLQQNNYSIILLLFYLGLILTTYAWMQFFKNDFMVVLFPWLSTNSFPILTFGNSNFSSVFLAFTFTATLCIFLDSIHGKSNIYFKFFSILSLVSHGLLIPRIDTQGKIAYGIGLAIVIFIFLKFSSFRHANFYSSIWFTSSLVIGIFGLLALRGIGPFAGTLSDNLRALNDRYFAWKAAIEMMKDFPIFGVGMNSFIDSYRLYRLPESYEVITQQYYMDFDNAHNTYLQIGSTLGVLSLAIYLIIVLFISYKAFKVFQNKKSNHVFNSGMLAIWIIYLVTSIISIDYIMLAMLGWVCAGALVANGNQVDFDNLKINKNFKIYNKPYRFKLLTLITILLALAPTVYLIPFLSNEKRVFDLISRIPKSISKIEMQSNIEKLTFVAENTGQLELRLVIIDYLGYAGANDSVIKLSKLSIVDNPKSFWAWEFLARALESKGMPEEALKARIKTLELDPLNQLIRSRLPENQRN